MQINIKKIPPSRFKRFRVFAKPDLDLLRETKTISVTVDYNTKTTLTTDMQWGDYCVKINKVIPGYKLHSKNNFSMFTGSTYTDHFFKLTKDQQEDKYIEYLQDLIEDIFTRNIPITLDVLTVELHDNVFTNK